MPWKWSTKWVSIAFRPWHRWNICIVCVVLLNEFHNRRWSCSTFCPSGRWFSEQLREGRGDCIRVCFASLTFADHFSSKSKYWGAWENGECWRRERRREVGSVMSRGISACDVMQTQMEFACLPPSTNLWLWSPFYKYTLMKRKQNSTTFL